MDSHFQPFQPLRELGKFNQGVRRIGQLLCVLSLFLAVSVLPVSAAGGDKVTGTVKDSYGKPLPGVAVMVVGTETGALTDESGVYSIDVAGPESELEFSCLGMLTVTQKVGHRSVVDVVMKDDIIGLEDVVVTGYTTMKRKDITGSVSSVSADKIERIPAYDLTTSLVGVAGIRLDGGSIRISDTKPSGICAISSIQSVQKIWLRRLKNSVSRPFPTPLDLSKLGRHQLIKLRIAWELIDKRDKRTSHFQKPLTCTHIRDIAHLQVRDI